MSLLYLNEEEATVLEEITRCTYSVADEYNKLMDMEVNGKSIDGFNLYSLKKALDEESKAYLVFKDNSSLLFSILSKLEDVNNYMENTDTSLTSSSCIIDRIVSVLKIMSIYSKIYDDIKSDIKLSDRKSFLLKKYDNLFTMTICESYVVNNNFDFKSALEEINKIYGSYCDSCFNYFYEIYKATIDDLFINITDENYEDLSFKGELLSHYVYLRSILVFMDDKDIVNARNYFDLVFNSSSYIGNHKFDKNKKHIKLIEKAFDEVSSDKVRYRDKK